MKARNFVGDYELGKKLGSGGYGRVYLGVNKTQGGVNRKAAIKIINPDNLASAMREANLLIRCQHENVLGIQGWEFSRQLCVVVLDLMKRSLSSVKTRFTYVEVKRLMKQLLLALAACHQRRVCHLDIKPENILLDAQNNVKLADFGIASESEDNANISWLAFSARYRPPEVILGGYYDGYKADMWAVGLVFAFLSLKNQDLLCTVEADDNMIILYQICAVFGKPSETTWRGVSHMPNYHLLGQVASNGPGLTATLKVRHSCPPKEALQLMEQMLTMDPTRRITAEEALQSQYFTS